MGGFDITGPITLLGNSQLLEIDGPRSGVADLLSHSYDGAGNRVLVVNDGAGSGASVISVDLATGDRTVLSDNANYPGPSFQPYTSCMEVNIPDQLAYVGDQQQKRVLAVDLTTGERVIAIR